MKTMNIYLCGVGGQGIALLSEVMMRACQSAGYDVKGVETHGLAQRGGIVVSHLRIGEKVHHPMIPQGQADLVISLERLEGLRGASEWLKPGGTVVYYDSVYQPTKVRQGLEEYPETEQLQKVIQQREGQLQRVHVKDLPDARMQNVALLGRVASLGLVEKLTPEIVTEVLKNVVPSHAMEMNLQVFKNAAQA